MKEAPRKKLPPKSGMTAKNLQTNGQSATTTSTPTKSGNDEILNSLLRINNFDSISRESLDIDLSACVTISADPAAMMSGNSLSSTDFWRMLDESAQNPQMENTISSDETNTTSNVQNITADDLNSNSLGLSSLPEPGFIKVEPAQSRNSFSGNFLRPEPPTSLSSLFSPLKKGYKTPTPATAANIMLEHPHPLLSHQRKLKIPTLAPLSFETKKTRIATIKVEPPEQLFMDVFEGSTIVADHAPLILSTMPTTMKQATTITTPNTHTTHNVRQAISSKFGLFKLPSPTGTIPSVLLTGGNPKTSPPSLKPFTIKKASQQSSTPDKMTKLVTSSPCLIPDSPAQQLTTATQQSIGTSNITSNMSESGGSTHPPTSILTATTTTTSTTGTGIATAAIAQPITALPIYKCRDCEGTILSNVHMISTHELNGHQIIYGCSLCEREFDLESGQKKHLKTHRSVETRKDVWKKCPDCGKCLKLGSMWMHRKIHSDNKKYGCEICGQKFVQKINLTHHSRVHTAEKPFECPECQKRFQERSHLQRHQKYHAQTRSYRCEKCGKMYKTERCLKVHNLVHLEQRPFACTVCDKSFISNSKLKQHSNIHTGERPFKCNYCPRDFTNFPNWLKHTRRRHKVDHKTGEHLENIPSYCSKKSTKVAKEKAATSTTTTTATTITTTSTVAGAGAITKVGDSITTNVTTIPINVPTAVPAVSRQSKTVTEIRNPATAKSLHMKTPKNDFIPNTSSNVSVLKTTVVATAAPHQKLQAKRKKKMITTNECAASVNGQPTATEIIAKASSNPVVDTDCSANAGSPISNDYKNTINKVVKVKRERKQPAPKQVQKTVQPPMVVVPPLLQLHTQAKQQLPLSTQLTIIKKEPVDCKVSKMHSDYNYSISSKTLTPRTHSLSAEELEIVSLPSTILQPRPLASDPIVMGNSDRISTSSVTPSSSLMPSNFPDLHCLSITSAEELIMEQALEMEECGLYVPNSADMDNAISADTPTASTHFKIKHEFCIHDEIIKEEEVFGTLKDVNTRALCSSLESSPFSSPASVELPSTITATTTACAMIPLANTLSLSNGNNFFITSSPFTIESSGGATNIFATHSNNVALSTTTVATSTPCTFTSTSNEEGILSTCSMTPTELLEQATQTQTLINQYLPSMTISDIGNSLSLSTMPATNQMLPSVDTLLFSAAAAAHNATAGVNSGVSSSSPSSAFFNSSSIGKTTSQHNLT